MSEFTKILATRNLQHHSGEPLWKYQLTDFEFKQLQTALSIANRITDLDPRDCALYFAEWWKREFDGTELRIEKVYSSIGREFLSTFDHRDFYKRAKTGAEMLGFKWKKKQNTLFFRTLLLQGGLPLKHISDNQSNYKSFLLAVLEEQPKTIEHFIFQDKILNLLPISGRDAIVYENCFEIVRSILNDENTYDDLFSSNEAIKEIGRELKIRKNLLPKKERSSKPQNYWLLNFNKQSPSINLRLGLVDIYSAESLGQIFGFEVGKRQYQFFINDQLICIFRKMLSGNYKTNWNNQLQQEWKEGDQLPDCYVIADDEKREVADFIHTFPDLKQPSLWAPFSDNEWRLIKGSNSSSERAALLFPESWITELECETITFSNKDLKWLNFEGHVELSTISERRNFLTNVSSFDWAIVSQKPNLMLKSNLVVTRDKPVIYVYDEKNEIISNKNYDIYVKLRASSVEWQLLNEIHILPIGCIDLKIVKDGVKAFDNFFNIGSLNINYSNQTIDSAMINIINNRFIFKLDESNELSITEDQNYFKLNVNLANNKIPKSISGSLKGGTSRSLFFELVSPFIGMTLIDQNGRIIPENEDLTFNHLHGIRILSPANGTVIAKLSNALRPDVVISKEIKIESQPLISYRDELLRLYFLADAMNYKNTVVIELQNGSQRKQYSLKGFTHTLDVDNIIDKKITLFNSEDDLLLYAVPLNCPVEDITLIPLSRENSLYSLPETTLTQQFIIISSYEANRHLMPRFLNMDLNFVGIDKNARIEQYHNQLKDSDFNSDMWKQILVYFNICISQNLPFSTFDQLRAISRSSLVASKAFFYLGINQTDSDEFIQKTVPDLEKDLGFCFHWVKKDDWETALGEAIKFVGDEHFEKVAEWLRNYMTENDLSPISPYLSGQQIKAPMIYNPFIAETRQKLGARVLSELPRILPHVSKYYNIPYNDYGQVENNANSFLLLINAPIAAAESIKNVTHEYPIWGGDDFREKIRRNIQYAHYLAPEFYSRIIQQVLSQN